MTNFLTVYIAVMVTVIWLFLPLSIVRSVTPGDLMFVAGFVMECVALGFGVHTKVVGWSLVAYGLMLVWKGYL